MKVRKKDKAIFVALLIAVAVFSLGFVSIMGFLNYRSLAIEMETQVIGRVESEMVDKIETAVSFGKSFDQYYGIEDVFDSFSAQYAGPVPFVISKDGELLYASESNNKNSARIAAFLDSGEFEMALDTLSGSLLREGTKTIIWSLR